ncbi:unnamed protein product [Urochloa humidicola]
MGQKRVGKGRWIPSFTSDHEVTPAAKRASSSKARASSSTGQRRPYTRAMASGAMVAEEGVSSAVARQEGEAGAGVDEDEGSDVVAVIEPKADEDKEVVVIPSSDEADSIDSGHDSDHEDAIGEDDERYFVTEEDLDNIWETINKLASDQGDINEAVTKLKRSLNKYMSAVVFKNGEEMEMLSGALATLKSKVKALEAKNAELAAAAKKNEELAASLARLEARMTALEQAAKKKNVEAELSFL